MRNRSFRLFNPFLTVSAIPRNRCDDLSRADWRRHWRGVVTFHYLIELVHDLMLNDLMG